MRFIERIPLQTTESTSRVPVPRSRFIAVVGVWVLVVLYTAQVFLPKNVLHFPGQETVHEAALVVAPQGWAFFTKSAKSTEFVPFRFRDGAWRDVRLAPHAKPSNAFGFDRASRSQGIEGALLLHEKGIVWRDCGDDTTAADCLKDAPVTRKMTNRSPSPTICGRAALVEMKPVPWAWRDLLPLTHTPVRAAVWEVTC
ncbi:SdpA family antimicrobial peptide system protein [Streptomyces sp. NPDC059452]|uniref:SdpA family antimicrobial peptide system protein n=1 Tax=Streptomyces sp. NPDC059452 TaxID=3346835 RepID=UPI0036B3633B